MGSFRRTCMSVRDRFFQFFPQVRFGRSAFLLGHGTKIAAYGVMMKTSLIARVFKAKGGFTIVELMVVLAVMLGSLLIAIPTYNATIKPTAQLKAAARSIFSDIQLGKLRAVAENVRYGLVFYASPDRYVVFVDDGPANGQYDGGEQVIKTVALASDFGKVQFDTSCALCGGDGITFANNAFSMTTRALASGAGTVFLKNEKNEGRSVVVNTVGGARIEEYNP